MTYDLPIQSALTPEEKLILKNNSYWAVMRSISGALLWAFFLISLLSFIVLKWIASFFEFSRGHDYTFIYFLMGAFFGLSFILRIGLKDLMSFRDMRQKLKPQEDDLKAGYANVQKYDVLRVVEILEHEDEGAGFFLELSDGRVLCVIGQDLCDYAHDFEAQPEEGLEDKRYLFPQTMIEYRYAPRSARRLGIKGTGEALRPYARVKTSRKFFKKDKATGQITYIGPEDGVFYQGSMEDIIKQFGYKLEVL